MIDYRNWHAWLIMAFNSSNLSIEVILHFDSITSSQKDGLSDSTIESNQKQGMTKLGPETRSLIIPNNWGIGTKAAKRVFGGTSSIKLSLFKLSKIIKTLPIWKGRLNYLSMQLGLLGIRQKPLSSLTTFVNTSKKLSLLNNGLPI